MSVSYPRACNVIPLSGEMGEAQKVIPFLREMSRSDKRFADVLRLPPGYGLTRAINQTLVLYQVFLREQTPVPAGGHTVIPLSGEMGEAQKGCRRAKVRPYEKP